MKFQTGQGRSGVWTYAVCKKLLKILMIQQDDLEDLGILNIRSQVFQFPTMSTSMFLAQSSGTKAKKASQEVPASNPQIPPLLLVTSGGLALAVIALIVYSKLQMDKLEKNLSLNNSAPEN